MLVLAGAGTGKTRVITHRIAELIRRGTAANRILAVTFTNKAAREMRERAMKLLGQRPKLKPEISTFHSLCVQLLKRQITHLGYPRRFAIYDRGDQESIAKTALREVQMASEAMKPGDLLAIISRWKNQGFGPADARRNAVTDKDLLAAACYRRYQEALKTLGAVDFDDLLLCTDQIFREFPDIRDQEAGRYDQILVDEYQDTNSLQYRITKALADGHRNLCVVGDDDQSIYAWRGAEVTHILNFTRDWPDAKVIRLEDNYRSTGPILQKANTLIAYNTMRHGKVLRPARESGEPVRVRQFEDEEQEAAGVVGEIAAKLATNMFAAGDFAVLFRTNEQPRPFEMEFRRQRVPYKLVGGQSFYDRKEVRDLIAYLRVLDYPQDEISLLRIINTPARGISPTTIQTLTQEAVSGKRPLWSVLNDPSAQTQITERSRQAVADFLEMMKRFRTQLKHKPIAEVYRSLVETIDYQSELRRVYKEEQELTQRWKTVEDVANAIGAYESQAGSASLEGFLEETVLGDRDFDHGKNKEDQRAAVTLMTLHSAKGLEFPIVYLVGMEEGLLPHKRSVEAEDDSISEERRLAYVGMTRAIDQLTLTFAQARRKWGKLRPTCPSRFLFEMNGDADHPAYLKAKAAVRAAERAAQNRRPPRK